MRIETDVHFFSDEKNQRYCLDVNSSKIFQVDEAGETAIRMLPAPAHEIQKALAARFGPEPARAAARAVSGWIENGFFAGNTKQERLAVHPDRHKLNLLGVSLFISGACNLRCVYCFNDGGAVAGSSAPFMTPAVAERSISFLLDHGEGQVGLDFFGGEPLLARELIRQAVEFCEKSGREFQFAMITNGAIMSDEIVDFFERHKFHIVVSYDGYLQEMQRPAKAGDASMKERVRQNIRTLARRLPPRDISIRCVLTHDLVDHDAIIREARELGVRVLFGPVTVPPDHRLHLDDDDLDRYMRMEERVLMNAVEQGDGDTLLNVTAVVNHVLRIMTGKQMYYSCGIGKDILGVSPEGGLYPCHRFVGLPEYKMGDVFTGLDEKLFKNYADRYVDNRPGCRGCWARYFCGGGCAHESLVYNGEVGGVVESRCRLHRWEVELGLRLFTAALAKRPEMLETVQAGLKGSRVEVRQFDDIRHGREVME